MSMNSKKRISCLRCQQRKIKCTREFPCSNCQIADQQCRFRDHDVKRRPVSNNYVTALEDRIAWFESFVSTLKLASPEERDNMLKHVTFQDHLRHDTGAIRRKGVESYLPTSENRLLSVSLQRNVHGSLLYHGPTSVYQESLFGSRTPRIQHVSSSIAHGGSPKQRNIPKLNPGGHFINQALSLFFVHQYPQYMFVYREAFLTDYFEQQHTGNYWSYPLLYALCALGAILSPEKKIRDSGDALARCAQELVIAHELESPDITTVQALLCLAFYEVGKGNHSKGWSLSGMAFRMGQDLGFQQDPKLWASQDNTIVSELDLEIRRRIYWGCYVADKLISLYLGRPVFLHEEDASVDPTEPLPDLSPSDTWSGLKDHVESSSLATSPSRLITTFKCMIELSKAIQDMLSQIFSPKSLPQSDSLETVRSHRLSELNTSLFRWHTDLPDELKYKSSSKTYEPQIAMLSIFYHSILICMNRHFVGPSPGFPPSVQSKEVCIKSADSIIFTLRRLRAQQKISNSPVTLVYGAMIAASVLLLIHETPPRSPDVETNLRFLSKVLRECSSSYGMAVEAQTRLSDTLERDGGKSCPSAQLGILADTSPPLEPSVAEYDFVPAQDISSNPCQIAGGRQLDMEWSSTEQDIWSTDWAQDLLMQDASYGINYNDIFGGAWFPPIPQHPE